MNGWDWQEIDVQTGEWWLLLLGLAPAIIALCLGYWLGHRKGYAHAVEAYVLTQQHNEWTHHGDD